MKIESDGTPFGTKVFDSEGNQIRYISALDISFAAGEPATAKAVFCKFEELYFSDVEMVVCLSDVKMLAAQHGMKLVPIDD